LALALTSTSVSVSGAGCGWRRERFGVVAVAGITPALKPKLVMVVFLRSLVRVRGWDWLSVSDIGQSAEGGHDKQGTDSPDGMYNVKSLSLSLSLPASRDPKSAYEKHVQEVQH
jgi:hypothetical protein